jgi:hypothetical protein
MLSGCSIYYQKPEELLNKLDIVTGEIKAGNNNKSIVNDGIEILDTLLKNSAITHDQHKTIYRKFFV